MKDTNRGWENHIGLADFQAFKPRRAFTYVRAVLGKAAVTDALWITVMQSNTAFPARLAFSLRDFVGFGTVS